MIKKPIEEMTRDELATYARHLLSMIANLQAANAQADKRTGRAKRERDVALTVGNDAIRELERILETGDTYCTREIVQNLKNFLA